ncbi:MAG: DUF4115 domain-containing protein [Deltaproteobacteria bacterium]|nr:DUF4115 domain-containing protein [Deltaproteobacteria bacterium]
MENREQKEGPELDLAAEDTGVQKGPGLGLLLKNEREKKGLTHEQVAQITRLRKHYVEALEKEEWDKLPPRVFTRGFVRSYAQLLGLDEQRILSLYERSVPKTQPPLSFKKFSKKKRGSYYLIGVVGALVVAVGLYIGITSISRMPTVPEEREALRVVEEKTGIETRREGSLEAPLKGIPPEDTAVSAVEPSLSLVEPGPGKSGEGTARVEEKDLSGGEAAVPPSEERGEESQPGEIAPGAITEGETGSAAGGEAPSIAGVPGPVPAEPETTTEILILTGIVKDKTWVRICIDDQDPKEYIFKPGSRPQWRAKHGFYVLVGNAAGIDFDFNGKIIENLGEIGRVKRLRLPKEFRGTKCED